VTGVVDVAPEYRMEEIEASPGCPGAGRPLADIAGPAIVAAVRRASGELVPQPPSDTVVEAGDVLVVMGTPETIGRLETLFTPEAEADA
jgi:Trk K+ transport system NAD-binding subunit